MKTSALRSYLLVVFASLFLAACNSNSNGNNASPTPTPAAEEDPGPGNIVDVASDAGDFSTLITALEAAGLIDTLSDDTAVFTVFAPTDEAFDALGQDTIDTLLGDPETLSNILLYHVIGEQAVDADTAISLAGTTVEMANGDWAALTLRDGDLFINESRVTTTDIEASNGIIHVLDAVLTPPEPRADPDGNIVEVAMAAGDFTTLVAALQATGLDATLADDMETFTVFAPTDDAFDLLGEDTINALLADLDTLSDILLYHVIVGAAVDSITATSLFGQAVEMANGDSVTVDIRDGALFINESEVIIANVPATNGTIHVIDKVLTPPADEPGTIVAVAQAAGSFTTLIAALEATGLDATLTDETSQFTVFAPNDDAFALLGEETIDNLLADPDTLSNILLYHVIADQVVEAETALTLDGSMVEMANGDSVTLTVTDGELFVDDSKVIATDIHAVNGIIHVLDSVLSPPAPPGD